MSPVGSLTLANLASGCEVASGLVRLHSCAALPAVECQLARSLTPSAAASILPCCPSADRSRLARSKTPMARIGASLYEVTPRVLIELPSPSIRKYTALARPTTTFFPAWPLWILEESRLVVACSLVTRSRRAWRVTDMGLLQFHAYEADRLVARNSSRKLRPFVAWIRRPPACRCCCIGRRSPESDEPSTLAFVLRTNRNQVDSAE